MKMTLVIVEENKTDFSLIIFNKSLNVKINENDIEGLLLEAYFL